MPDGCIDLVWTGKALIVAGPDTGPVIEAVPPDAVIVGIRFRPGEAQHWLKVSSLELASGRLPLADLWKEYAVELAERLFESATPETAAILLERSLAARMRGDIPSDRTSHHLRRALRGRLLTQETQVRELGRDLGLSERSVRRRCRELFGYGPKTFSRILRFQRFIKRAERADRISISALAGFCGYADQAHLSREVRRLSGLTPAAVLAQFLASGRSKA